MNSKQVITEDTKLREIKLAAHASLYLDIAVIALVYVATIILRKKKTVLYLMLGAYLILYFTIVFYGRKPYPEPRLHLDLFWSYRLAFDGFKIKRMYYAKEILQNILVYIPLGMILAAIFRQSKHRLLWPVLIGLCLSVFTEVVQYLTTLGITELDDVMDNGFGLLLGILIMNMTLSKVGKKSEEDLEYSH